MQIRILAAKPGSNVPEYIGAFDDRHAMFTNGTGIVHQTQDLIRVLGDGFMVRTFHLEIPSENRRIVNCRISRTTNVLTIIYMEEQPIEADSPQ